MEDDITQLWMAQWPALRDKIEAWRSKRRTELAAKADALNRQTGDNIVFTDDALHYVSVLMRLFEAEQRRNAALIAEVEALRAAQGPKHIIGETELRPGLWRVDITDATRRGLQADNVTRLPGADGKEGD